MHRRDNDGMCVGGGGRGLLLLHTLFVHRKQGAFGCINRVPFIYLWCFPHVPCVDLVEIPQTGSPSCLLYMSL